MFLIDRLTSKLKMPTTDTALPGREEALPTATPDVFQNEGDGFGAIETLPPPEPEVVLVAPEPVEPNAELLAQITALQAIPFKGVHAVPRRMTASRAIRTLEHLNALSRQSVGDSAAVFRITGQDPIGTQCFAGPYGIRARALCCGYGTDLHCDLPDVADLM